MFLFLFHLGGAVVIAALARFGLGMDPTPSLVAGFGVTVLWVLARVEPTVLAIAKTLGEAEVERGRAEARRFQELGIDGNSYLEMTHPLPPSKTK